MVRQIMGLIIVALNGFDRELPQTTCGHAAVSFAKFARELLAESVALAVNLNLGVQSARVAQANSVSFAFVTYVHNTGMGLNPVLSLIARAFRRDPGQSPPLSRWLPPS